MDDTVTGLLISIIIFKGMDKKSPPLTKMEENSLERLTESIRSQSRAVKKNFFEIGRLLIQIREKQLYLAKYPTFTEYLEGEEFEFSRMHAYRFIKICEEFDVTQCYKVSLRKLLELAKVTDKEVREDLMQRQAPLKEIESRVKRSCQREDEDVFVEIDSKYDKMIRIGVAILEDLGRVANIVENMDDRIKRWNLFRAAQKKETEESKRLSSSIFLKADEIRKSI